MRLTITTALWFTYGRLRIIFMQQTLHSPFAIRTLTAELEVVWPAIAYFVLLPPAEQQLSPLNENGATTGKATDQE